jgi:hypothetical protein
MRSALSIVFVGLGSLVLVACGDGGAGDGGAGNSRGTGGSGGVTLDCTTLTNPPPDCQKSCASDSQCEASFCSNGVCLAQCTADEGCATGSSCNISGRCVPDMGTGGTAGTGNIGGSGCQSVEVTPTRSIPNVMFLVDQSGSMDANDFGPMNLNRWTAAHSAITSIVSDPLDDIVRFGLTTYTSDNGNENECPRLPVAGNPLASSPRVDFGLNSGGAIANTSIYPSSYPSDAGNDTPTGDSIEALVDVIQASPPPNEGPTIIVLATDGEPDSCECPDSGHPLCDTAIVSPRDQAVNAAASAHSAGIDVFVLWVGELNSDSTRNHLQDVADAGVEGDGTVWVGDNPANLSDAFQAIISDSISCEVQMDKQFDDKDKACDEGNVQLNGTPLSCPNDWQVKPGADDVIELVGSACDTFKSGSSTFSAVFPCGAIIVE